MSRFRAGTTPPISVILVFVFPAIVAAALALAYYGYRYNAEASNFFFATFQETARSTAEPVFEDLEKRIDAESRPFFAALEGQREHWCEAALPPHVLSFVILKDGKKGQCPAIGGRRATSAEWEAIWAELDWRGARPGQFFYLHRLFKNQSVLLALYSSMDGAFQAAARLNLDLIQRDWLKLEMSKLSQTHRVEIIDERGNDVFASAPGKRHPRGDDRFVYDTALGKTLYAWRIRLAPPDVEAAQAKVARQKIIGSLLVILSTTILAVGLGIVWLAVLAERRASRLKSDFIANVSHELKTPLSLIRMFGEMVATGRHKGEDTAREYGAIITRESERLSHLIDNVLDFARLERGKASYDFLEGDLGEVVERALDICRYRLEKEKVRLHVQIEADLPPVRMDENALTLVILNLVDNAIKYASEGGEVDVSLARTPGGVVLSVQDHGPGVEAEEHSRIFERFYRARGARDRNVRGSGIGLALVQHIAQAHGGRVTVKSPAPGGTPEQPGALFRVYLPAPVPEGSGSLRRSDVTTLDPLKS